LAVIRSSIKRARTIKAKTLRNKMIRSNMRTMIKKFENLLANGNIDEAKNLFPLVVKRIDMAASKGTIHKNTANRKKSRLAIRLNKAVSSQQ
jgi:small subunit ribosomal protein S20